MHVPTELVREIFLYCEPPELATLCRTSHRFRSIGKAILYRQVHIRSQRQATAFAYASEENGPLVKSMSMLLLKKFFPKPLSSFPKAIDSTLHSLKNLESLQIYTPTILFGEAFTFWKLTFPHLRSLSLGHIDHFHPFVISFLNRHPQMTSFSLHDHFNAPSGLSDTDCPIVLNKLVKYKGPNGLLSYILRHSTEIQLQSVSVDWGRQDPANYLDTLQSIHNSSSSKSLRTLLCRGISLPTLLIMDVAKCLPDISSLAIYTAYRIPTEGGISLPLEDMRRFRRLTKLFLHGNLRFNSVENALNGIANACPSIATMCVVSDKQVENWIRYKEKDQFSWKLAQS